MLSWSSTEQGDPADLTAVAAGAAGVGIAVGDELVRFASACAGTDDVELGLARTGLVAASDEAFMIDAAAVAANFEMMTRLADGTGASMPDERTDLAAPTIEAFAIGTITSRR
ncbi:MAG TPA: hypothetical protein VLA10_09305 [Ilumatobacter sp.]|nr:hypothetical protein [Ilumatobacter sp.]